jgi:DNA-binding transcriptional MerR regulator
VNNDYLQIGDVAQLTGLSLNTIRRYEHFGLIASTQRSKGGFRLYTDTDVQRLQALVDMRPLDFSVEEKRGLFDVLDRLASGQASVAEREMLLDRLAMFGEAADQRVTALRDQLHGAETFAAKLKSRLNRDWTSEQSPSGSGPVL